MDISKINRLNNEYRALRSKAIEIHSENNNLPSVQEGLCYQKAAQICSELARLTLDSEELHWVQAKQECEFHMREIAQALGITGSKDASRKPVAPVRNEPETSNKPAAPEAKKRPKNENKENNSGVSQDKIDSWFDGENKLDHFLKDVVGMKDTIALLQDCINDTDHAALDAFLKMPTVRSFFFYGPPGCGKTYTIEAFANELYTHKNYRFMKLGSADIHSKFSGEADKIVEQAFEEAAKNAPCILFIDEIDGVCQNRSLPHLSDFNMQLTTTFLNCFNDLSKLNKERKSVIFIGATNYPANVDVAMLDRVELVQIPLPDPELRAHSFAWKFRDMKLEEGFSWKDIAEQTEGYNQRDINRVADRILILMRKEVIESFDSDDEAIEALTNGTYRLRRAVVEQALSEYVPTPKNDIETQLCAFEEKMRRC